MLSSLQIDIVAKIFDPDPEIFTQKTGAHVLFESLFKIIFALLEAECYRFLISNLA